MKYDMIFGDQSLYDNASDGAVLAIKDTTSGRIHFFTNKGWIKSGLKHERHIGTSDNEIAMRRIIKDKVDDENELENLYWEFDSQRSKKTTDERLLFKGKLRYYASIASVDKSTKEPNRWTWEDKKAGVLPDVGCEVMVIDTKMVCTVNAICKIYKSLSLTFPDGSLGMVELEDIDPIESPEEKAARLKSEWCAKAAKQLKNLEYTSTLTSIYDALLSGELPMPGKWSE